MHGGELWRAVMYVGYGSSSCCSRQLVPHTPVGAHNVTMTCEHLWQHRVGTTYYIGVCITSAWLHARVARLLTRSKYNARRARISKTMPCQSPVASLHTAIVSVTLSCVPRNFTRAYRHSTIFQRRIIVYILWRLRSKNAPCWTRFSPEKKRGNLETNMCITPSNPWSPRISFK